MQCRDEAHLFPVHLALRGEQAFVACRHAREAVAHKVGLGVVVSAAHDVVDCEGVGRHKPAAAEEAAVDESGAVRGCPARDEPVVLLVVHLAQVADEEGGGRGAAEVMVTVSSPLCADTSSLKPSITPSVSTRRPFSERTTKRFFVMSETSLPAAA